LTWMGLFYLLKIVHLLSWKIYIGVKHFVLPRLVASPDYKNHYGKWAVVTGCTGGIGEQYAYELAKRGLDLILISRSHNKLEKVASKIGSTYGIKTEIVPVDFADGRSAVEIGLKGVFANKDIGILVNNVGTANHYPQFFDEISEDDIWSQVNVNMASMLTLTKAVLPIMQAKCKGAIINVGSMAGTRPIPLMSVYGASKAFVGYWTECLRMELQTYGIDVLLLEPSFIATRMTQFCDKLSRPSLFCPSPATYAQSSILTFGWASRTTGYWAHALRDLIDSIPMMIIPEQNQGPLLMRRLLQMRNETKGVTKREC